MSFPRLHLRLREQIPLLLLGLALAVGGLCWALQIPFPLFQVHDGAPVEARELLRRHAALSAVLLALLVASSALPIGLFLHRRVTLRARRIVDIAERYGRGERGLGCELAGHDELAHIGQALDRMMVRVDGAQARLAEAENAQRRLIENLPGAVLIDYADRPGYTKYASPQLKTLFGHDPAQWVAGGYEYWYEHIHPADRDRAVGPWRESCENGTPYFCEYRLMAPDGQLHWVQDMANGASVVVDGERLCYGFMLDVSARRQTEEALREHIHLLKTAQAVAGVGAWSIEPSFDGRVRWSDETYLLFGLQPGHSPPTVRAWFDGVHVEDRARVVAAFERLFAEENDGSIELRYRYHRADGATRWILAHADKVWSSYDDRRLVAGVVRDVTEQIETERHIERLAYHDLLTGLPNRAQLVERLRTALVEARRRGNWIRDQRILRVPR